ncbi:hypothetical protein H4R33_000620 [Dimargaris cristalligena]|uniref:Uncharacterized protein n=1 Tax=Dimargaris cristalligena TaxID=215637 RepID=A0A4Q0A0M0_9FUNG|nr:hypothetical protein H4R33_000620 [Dimargaris cristalligena]RKP38660.1 hypothetical protein BJ085DRAFT_36541 [Dimargaris cristalligena]|eukprot:RKP38660.1 hypothetical protein BJ085DRAFT_36541 [Dimargaris cristalligena]
MASNQNPAVDASAPWSPLALRYYLDRPDNSSHFPVQPSKTALVTATAVPGPFPTLLSQPLGHRIPEIFQRALPLNWPTMTTMKAVPDGSGATFPQLTSWLPPRQSFAAFNTLPRPATHAGWGGLQRCSILDANDLVFHANNTTADGGGEEGGGGSAGSPAPSAVPTGSPGGTGSRRPPSDSSSNDRDGRFLRMKIMPRFERYVLVTKDYTLRVFAFRAVRLDPGQRNELTSAICLYFFRSQGFVYHSKAEARKLPLWERVLLFNPFRSVIVMATHHPFAELGIEDNDAHGKSFSVLSTFFKARERFADFKEHFKPMGFHNRECPEQYGYFLPIGYWVDLIQESNVKIITKTLRATTAFTETWRQSFLDGRQERLFKGLFDHVLSGGPWVLMGRMIDRLAELDEEENAKKNTTDANVTKSKSPAPPTPTKSVPPLIKPTGNSNGGSETPTSTPPPAVTSKSRRSKPDNPDSET